MKGSGHWSPLVTPSPNSSPVSGYLISGKLLRAKEKKAQSAAKQAGAFGGGAGGGVREEAKETTLVFKTGMVTVCKCMAPFSPYKWSWELLLSSF